MRINEATIRGFSRILDITASFRVWPSVADDGLLADYQALKGDWESVGKDIAEATSIGAEKFKASGQA